MSKGYYPKAAASPDFPELEEQVLAHWKQHQLFEKSVQARPNTAPDGANNEYVFYDGPPFANGLPHYGHLLTGYVKDVFARYQTMQGKRVERRFGWDCHGLPAEMGSEKELGISGRLAITEYGIGKFNEHCRSNVMKYAGEWEDYVTRQARWVDFSGDYKTMDVNFMESVIWAFKQLHEKGLVYESHRVLAYSWAAETPVSNFETKLDNSYREKEDKAVTVAFELKEKPEIVTDLFPEAEKCCVLAWTTTPWTLPSNLALAARKEGIGYIAEYLPERKIVVIRAIEKDAPYNYEHYLETKKNKNFSFLQKEMRELNNYKIMIPSSLIIGQEYRPLFPYFKDHQPDKCFRILDGSSFIEEGSGTGIVHMAPGFGEDDQRVCQENGIELVVPVDGQGKYTDEIFDLPDLKLKGLNVIAQTEGQCEGEPYKPEQLAKYGLVNLRIINWLKIHGKLIKQEDYKHNYPHCWRTDTPLIYRAMPSWYVEVTKFRDRAAELNQQINWIPEHVRDGQMGHMLSTAPDWSISRNRFWGTPIPVWKAPSGKIKVIGSIAELKEVSGQEVTDLHRPFIDEVTFEIDGETYTRVEDVFDCWFESGSMPFAQVHYPFENKDWFEHHFPADFITEYVGQTRGWFNTLIMLSTALFDKPPFKNCICHGVVLDAETGLKYSKRLKNYKDPQEVIDQFGADSLRWLMINSPVMRGADLAVDPEGKFIRDVVRLAIKPIWNAYSFFCLYANADGLKAEYATDSQNEMDRYILAKMERCVSDIESALDAYMTPDACDAVTDFFDVLNNWYIRRSKERFWKEEQDADKQAAYNTLYTVLVTLCKAAAPLLPLTLEEIYRGLTREESVHLADYPTLHLEEEFIGHLGGAKLTTSTKQIVNIMDRVKDICSTALSIRSQQNIRVRQPLQKLTVLQQFDAMLDSSISPIHIGLMTAIIRDEVNVKEVIIEEKNVEEIANYSLKINSKALGKRLPKLMKQIIPASKKGEWAQSNGSIVICGETLLDSEYDLLLEPKAAFADRAQALSSNDALVVLDTTITPELESEGIARDLVRMVQQARKDADFHVSDRIYLHVDGAERIINALHAHKQYLTEQTLSELSESALSNATFTSEGELDAQKITISIARAA